MPKFQHRANIRIGTRYQAAAAFVSLVIVLIIILCHNQLLAQT